jgi:hypothetical protein
MILYWGMLLSWAISAGVVGTTVRKPAALRRVSLDWEAHPASRRAAMEREGRIVFIWECFKAWESTD